MLINTIIAMQHPLSIIILKIILSFYFHNNLVQEPISKGLPSTKNETIWVSEEY